MYLAQFRNYHNNKNYLATTIAVKVTVFSQEKTHQDLSGQAEFFFFESGYN